MNTWDEECGSPNWWRRPRWRCRHFFALTKQAVMRDGMVNAGGWVRQLALRRVRIFITGLNFGPIERVKWHGQVDMRLKHNQGEDNGQVQPRFFFFFAMIIRCCPPLQARWTVGHSETVLELRVLPGLARRNPSRLNKPIKMWVCVVCAGMTAAQCGGGVTAHVPPYLPVSHLGKLHCEKSTVQFLHLSCVRSDDQPEVA